jgi:hypothetical protein
VNRLRAIYSPLMAQADNSPAPVAQSPPLVKGFQCLSTRKLALDFTLGSCAEELVRKHVASERTK